MKGKSDSAWVIYLLLVIIGIVFVVTSYNTLFEPDDFSNDFLKKNEQLKHENDSLRSYIKILKEMKTK